MRYLILSQLRSVSYMSKRKRCGVTDGKKVRLDLDVCTGKLDSQQIYALLDAVVSDDEEDIAMLIDDSDTEFVTVSDEASDFILSERDTISDSSQSTAELDGVETIQLDAVVYTDQPISISNLGRSQAEPNSCVMTVGSNYKATPGLSLRQRKTKQEKPAKVEEIPESSSTDPVGSRRSKRTPTPSTSTSRGTESKRRKMKGPAPMTWEWKEIMSTSNGKASNIGTFTVPPCKLKAELSFNFPEADHVEEKTVAEFWEYFTDFSQLCDMIAKESTRYAHQNGRSFACTAREIEVFFGVSFFMGVVRLPSYKDYWRGDEFGQELVRETLPRDRFFEILQNLHFSDNQDPQASVDKTWKIKPLLDHFNYIYQRYDTISSNKRWYLSSI